MSEKHKTYCGYVSIVGRTNVGKSTLLNKLVKKKISITSRKPFTTRELVIGIQTEGIYQIVYVDTPGLYVEKIQTINKLIDKCTSSNATYNVELVIFVVDCINWTSEDEMVLKALNQIHRPVILAINKIDNLEKKESLLPYISFLSQKMSFYGILPISAKNDMYIDAVGKIVRKTLPESIHYFPAGYVTNRSKKFLVSETIREKLMRLLGDELPYSITVEVSDVTSNNCGDYKIHGLVWVAHNRQKKIIIGNKGKKIKRIGIEARKDIEIIFNKRVHLKLWIKVKPVILSDKNNYNNFKHINKLYVSTEDYLKNNLLTNENVSYS
ncbi:GTP-binding protein Era [secondary endosymbiont of Heteropsylla cubana]|uniref:GTPase Era n=1 Tax=secondary endosymbiont of Heteropsylla cubana TaxID=134287 RepID=J3TYK3_9ENTR|nr:GTPase Era [secondary endosymbiont of Heteropsylla cubana]AFP85460.1 GTP-binding protein Era [secondary endosymbiont of Heteropsylla cubana]